MLTAVVSGAADGSLDDAVGAARPACPVAGYDGTLADRRRRRDAAPGHRSGPRPAPCSACTPSPARCVTADGRLLAFAVIADGSGSDAAAEGALDDVAAALAGCGCR